MNLRYPFKWMLGFILLLLLFVLFQKSGQAFLKLSFLSSFLIAFLIILPFAYLLINSIAKPIYQLTQKVTQLVSNHTENQKRIGSMTKPQKLSKAIDEIDNQFKTKMDEISKERDFLQTILKGMVEGVLFVDERGRILVVNEALKRFLSLPSDVANRTPLEIIRNVELEEAIRKVLREGKTISFELTLPSPPGKTFEVNVVGIVPSEDEMGSEGGRVRGAIAVFHDQTRLKELEKIRKDFVANVSHELRTPLTTIKGYVETLLEGAIKEEVALQFIQIIKRHTDRLTKIVEDLLTLSKIESKEFQLKKEAISVADLIEDALHLVKGEAEKKRIRLSSYEIPSNLLLMGDPYYLEQILINLLDNAIKYTPEGGEIILSAKERSSEEVELYVKDNGIGIPQEDLPRIFERFYRVNKGRSQELGGTGLGLSIVKHLVHAHGGRVWAESQLGSGSTFYITLPGYRK